KLFIRSNGAYTFNPENALPVPDGHFTIPDQKSTGNLFEIPESSTSRRRDVHIGKVRIGKVSKDNIETKTKSKRFIKPTVEEISAYCLERKNNVQAQKFFDYYESKGWVVGKSPMKDWKAAVRTWEKNNFSSDKKPQG